MNSARQTFTPKQLMTVYNLARASNLFESQRLRKALGIVQRYSTLLINDTGKPVKLDVNNVEAHTFNMATTWKCTCEDFKFAGKVNHGHCKHVIAAMLTVKAQRLAQGGSFENTLKLLKRIDEVIK